MKIGNKEINENSPCFIIAEAGANFRISDDPEINLKHALKLIDIAVGAKADAVKFQLYKAEKLYVKKAGKADYIGKEKTINQIIQEMELPYEWLPKLKKYCDEKNIIFLCTPFDEESVDELEKIGIEAYKIASYTISHIPLLKHIAKKGKPMIISTGASNIEDIKKAIKAVKEENNEKIILMQCTAKYPAPLNTINLKVIPDLEKIFDVSVGLSDHSREPWIAPLGAVALGAGVIEKHFTTDNSLPGPDHGFAILPNELKELVNNIRKMEKVLGKEKKEILEDEKELYVFARRHIYTKKNIKKKEILSENNLIILRSGKERKGLEPSRFETIKGKRAAKDIKKDEPLTEEYIDE
ncbi:MAG: N-acetylneuraminate synthase family protein [Nanoarchaeota archaeon]|nr:N-acetylneuraminate synthase family protein [Nanoarchaeota archaeon]